MVSSGLNNDKPIPDVDADQAEAFVLAVADGSLAEVTAIAAELRRLGVVDSPTSSTTGVRADER